MNKTILCFSIGLLTCISTKGANEKIIVIDEGTWQADNARLTLFEDGKIVSNQWFRDCNGFKLGDTPTDIVTINDNLIAIALNTSNMIQLIDASGKSTGVIEDIPSVRKLASDGNYIFATSYAHSCSTEEGEKEFTKGFVAKIDPASMKILSACEVGYEPEGVVYRNGYLFVGNSGGYSFQEDHDFETTLSVVDAETMTIKTSIDTGCKNLYGGISLADKYLCINAAGDYSSTPASGIIVDTDKAISDPAESFTVIPYPVTYSTATTDGLFYVIGTQYSYATGKNEVNYLTLNPEIIMESKGKEGISTTLPGTIASDIEAMTAPYDIYCNPYSGYIYATDAENYASAGKLYQWTPEGKLNGVFTTYINPGHIMALNGGDSGVEEIEDSLIPVAGSIYDLFGNRVTEPQKGNIYIINGNKIMFR
ncbi:MAG: hypothetical protein K2J15_01825 [Muribaculaceae bacterium]|nr:hypothetical protein [Muribaculaceae bacterium]